MSRVKSSIIALAVLMILVGALAALLPLIGVGQVPGPAKPPPSFGRPGNFYLTKTKHNGAQALTACAAGYHMASIWEIHDPSNLRYNTAYGLKSDDSGFGPPDVRGWVRMGSVASGCGPSGNCFAWTSANASDCGKLVSLRFPNIADLAPPNMAPWRLGSSPCQLNHGVWCVQD